MPEEMLSVREALGKAFAEEPAEEAAAPEEAAVEVSEGEPSEQPSGRERDEFGRFKAKDAAEPVEGAVEAQVVPTPAPVAEVIPEPNERVPAELRAIWKDLPSSAREAVDKMGRAFAERYGPIQPYDDMARQQGQSLAQVLETYTGIERTLRENPIQGLAVICQNMGYDLRQVAAHIMGQPAPDQNAELMQARQQVAVLSREVHAFRAEREQATQRQIDEFSAAHPRFNELSGDIAWLLKTGGASDLETAYAKAERLNPVADARTVATPATDPQPRKPTGPVSIKGAPSAGSNPAVASESLSAKEAIRRAFAAR